MTAYTIRDRLADAWDGITTGEHDAAAIGAMLDATDIVGVKMALIRAAASFEPGRYDDFVAAVRAAEHRTDLADLLAMRVIEDADAVQGWCGPEWREAIAEALTAR